MRRRKVRTIREEERPTLLLMAAGAVAGAAAGLYLGRRYRSMDAFLEDVRDRFGTLRDLWTADELQSTRRTRLHIDVDDEINDEDLDDEEDALEEVDEEELDDEAFATSEAYDEDSDEDEADDDDDELEDDDVDDELAAVARDNGSSESLRRAEDIARRLEERVLDALHDEPVLSSRSIEIAVVGDGVVELTGTVHSIEEISRAAALVRAIPGVSMVLNRIEVRMGGSIDTASVARDKPSE
jgi:osmotically-inducible protein OsmY